MTPLGNHRVRVVFDHPQSSITPGQAAVWYDGEVLLGGGVIEVERSQSVHPFTEV